MHESVILHFTAHQIAAFYHFQRRESLQPLSPAGSSQGPVREAQAHQRLRAHHGHVRHPRHDRGERAVLGRSVHKGKIMGLYS